MVMVIVMDMVMMMVMVMTRSVVPSNFKDRRSTFASFYSI